MDPRIKTLAKNLIHYSVSLQRGEKLLIEVYDDGLPLVKALVAEAYAVGGQPFVTIKNNSIHRALLLQATAEQLDSIAGWEAARMKEMDAYIGLRAGFNASELSDVPGSQMDLYQRHWWHPVHSELRVNQTKWCVLRYPNDAMAQLAGMSSEAFCDFYFDVCNLDYEKMSRAMDPLVELLNRTDRVRIVGPGTELTFSIKDIPAEKCCGRRNIPDGEVYTAPVRDSIQGTLRYNTPSVYQGVTYENIELEFKDGKIIRATANNSVGLNQVLDTDEGSRYIGEFALGIHPHITTAMKDTLFDEKIKGSFHFTPGSAYTTADNGNRSAVHWDLVCIQTPECGGGEIWFDDRLIRKDGLFVIPELAGLNPDALA